MFFQLSGLSGDEPLTLGEEDPLGLIKDLSIEVNTGETHIFMSLHRRAGGEEAEG